MSLGLETLVTGAVVAAAAAWAVRAGWRAMHRKTLCSTCGSTGDCPLAKAEPRLQELGDLRPGDGPEGGCGCSGPKSGHQGC